MKRRFETHAFSRKGAIAVLAAALMVVIVGMMAFAVDLGYIMVKRTQAQAAADAAALAAVDVLPQGASAVETVIDEMLAANGFDPDDEEQEIERTIEYGDWDSETRTFNTVSDPDDANAVRVEVQNPGLGVFFGAVFDQTSYGVIAQASAVRARRPRDIVMVLDCSTSMEEEMDNDQSRIANARAAAAALVDQLGDEDRVGLAVYSWEDLARNDYQKTGRQEKLLDFDKQPTQQRISELTDGLYTSGTNIGGGFRAGLDVFLNSSTHPSTGPVEKILVMLTDGKTNRAEPYPSPDDGPTGVLPPAPFDSGYKEKEAVTHWSNTIKARGILIYVITLGDSAHASLMVNAASPNDGEKVFYHHISEDDDDDDQLMDIYTAIGRGEQRPHLVD